MGLLDGLLGGAAGAAIFNVVSKAINDHGGIEGMVQKFQQGGLSEVVNSWVGTGQNQPVTPAQLQQTLGQDQIAQMAAKAGVTPEQMSQHLAEVLPQVVDKATPNGQLPAAPQTHDASSLQKLLGLS